MSTVTLKLTALIVRTLAKPIATGIKAQAREHPRFRKICIAFAQQLHRFDMRLKLGLLLENAELDRRSMKETVEVQARKHKHDLPLSSTSNGVEQVVPKDLESSKDQSKEKAKLSIKPRIRPLSETKAIDRGANFISEAFLFMVAGSLILFESLRARRRETNRREDVADRLSELEEKQQLALSTISRLRTELARLGSEQTSEPKSSVSTLSRSGIEGVGNDVKIGSPSS